MISHMSFRSSTSTPAVGSSRKRMDGSVMSAFAMSTRRFMPPERKRISSLRFSQSESRFRIFSTRSGFGFFPWNPRWYPSIFSAERKISRCISWGTSPIACRAARHSRLISCPSTVAVPEVLFTRPETMPMNVVFPAPFGPRRANISPRFMSMEISSRARVPLA